MSSTLEVHSVRVGFSFVFLPIILSLLPARLTAAVRTGDLFPSLQEATQTVDCGALPGTGGVVMVDFWASWCPPCKASFPAYTEIEKDYASRGVSIIAISVDEDPAAYHAFIRKMGPAFAIVRDVNHRLATLVDIPAMPACFLLGRDGRVRFVHEGFHGAKSIQELRHDLDAILAEKTGTQ